MFFFFVNQWEPALSRTKNWARLVSFEVCCLLPRVLSFGICFAPALCLFWSVVLYDWSRKLSPYFQPIRCENWKLIKFFPLCRKFVWVYLILIGFLRLFLCYDLALKRRAQPTLIRKKVLNFTTNYFPFTRLIFATYAAHRYITATFLDGFLLWLKGFILNDCSPNSTQNTILNPFWNSGTQI